MKSFIKRCLLACIALFSVACSNSVKLIGNEFLIEGKISGVEDGTVILLYRMDVSSRNLIASDTLKDGRFTLRGETESNPDQLAIHSIGNDGSYSNLLNVWAAPRTKIKIRGKDILTPLWEVKSSVPYQKEENRFVNNNRDIIAERARICVEASIMGIEMRAASAAGSEDEAMAYRRIIIDSLIVIDRALEVKISYNDIAIMEKADITQIWLNAMRNISNIVKNHYGIFDLDAEQAAYFREKALELYARMSEKDRNSALGTLITANLIPSRVAKVGEYMADAYLSDINGNLKNLADYLGKYLLLDFWNNVCVHCIRALPEMKEISEIYRDKLTIISISLDTDATWKEATATYDMPWINLRDPKSISGLAASYGVYGIPNYVMISPEGTIVDQWAGYGEGYLKQKVSENIEIE